MATGAASVIGTLIVPRSVANWLTRWVDLIVNGAFRLATAMSTTTGGATGCSPRRQATILIARLAARPRRASRRLSRRSALDVR